MYKLILNLFFLLFWLSLLYFFRRETNTLIYGLILGIISAICNYYLLFYHFKLVMFFAIYNLLILLEEFTKWISLYYYYSTHKPQNIDVYTVGAAVGIGFAFIENSVSYITRNLEILFIRGFTANIVHGFTCIILSYGLWKYKNTNKQYWLSLYFLSVLIHVLSNSVSSLIWP